MATELRYCTKCRESTRQLDTTSTGARLVNIFTLGMGDVCNGRDWLCLKCQREENEYDGEK